jgi:dephospho-CoA kinase
MENIAIIGGMGTGKTTLAEAILKEDPNIHYMPMSLYGAKIPMTLAKTTHKNLLSLTKSEYIWAILANKNIDLLDFEGKRSEMDNFEREVIRTYGPTVIAQTAFGALLPDVQNLADNVCTFNNVMYLKNRGFFVVSLYCDLDTRVRRCMRRKKAIDPTNRHDLERQISDTDRYFETTKTIHLADAVYDTTQISSEGYSQIAREILDVTK